MVTATWLLFHHWSQVSFGDESGVCVCVGVAFAKASPATHRVLIEGLDGKWVWLLNATDAEGNGRVLLLISGTEDGSTDLLHVPDFSLTSLSSCPSGHMIICQCGMLFDLVDKKRVVTSSGHQRRSHQEKRRTKGATICCYNNNLLWFCFPGERHS